VGIRAAREVAEVWGNPDRGDPMSAQGEAISSVSENSRNHGCQVEVGNKNPNGVALTFSGKCSFFYCATVGPPLVWYDEANGLGGRCRRKP